MGSSHETPDFNPYAVPESIRPRTELAVQKFSLKPGQEFRVLGQKLICRDNAKFADVCWLTGTTDVTFRPLVWKTKLSPAFLDHWCFQVPYFVVLFGFAFGDWPFWTGFAVATVILAMNLITTTLGEQFKLSTGQSVKAIEHERRVRWFVWIQIPVCVGIVMWWFLISNELAILAWLFTATWMMSSVVYWFRQGLETRRWQVRRTDDDSFVVTGLRPEFLKTLYLQQWEDS